jgi:hypothetical protein
MSDQVEAEVAAVSASVTGPTTPNEIRVERPTTKSEWTLLLAGAGLILFAAFFGAVLAFGPWPSDLVVAGKRIWFLGWSCLIGIGGLVVLVIAIASPWIGHVSASAGPGGINAKIDGGAG